MGAGMFHAYRQTDLRTDGQAHDEGNSRFSQLRDSA